MKRHSESIRRSSLLMTEVGEQFPTEFKLFTEGDELYAAMARSIRAATHRVFLVAYILAADEVGTVLLDEPMRQSRRGLDVRVHVDALGSISSLPRHHRRLINQLKKNFLGDLQDSAEITGMAWKRRGFISRIYDVFGRFLRKWL